MTELNHKLRAKGVGSSEIAMLVIGDDGKPLSPWGGPHKLWRKKTGVDIEKPEDESPWLARGHALEPYLLDRYATITGSRLRRAPGTVQHKKLPIAIDSVDALAWAPGDTDKPSRSVEAKAPLFFRRDDWGEEGTDQIPRQYLVQGQWHCGVWKTPFCDYPIDAPGDIRIYTAAFDEELFLCLVDIAEKFWKDHVESGVPPPPDATEETSQWLSRRLKQSNEDIVDADVETVKKMLVYRDLRLRVDADSEQLEKLANEIKTAIGEHKGLCIPGRPKEKVTFSAVKGKLKFHSENYIEELVKMLPEGVSTPDRQPFTSVGDSYRRFLPTGLLKGGEQP